MNGLMTSNKKLITNSLLYRFIDHTMTLKEISGPEQKSVTSEMNANFYTLK